MSSAMPARRRFMMHAPRAQAAFEHQQFFFQQKEKLSALLNAVGQDAKIAPYGSEIGIDFFELTTAITQLFEEAHASSRLTYDQIQRSGLQIQPFAEKVQMVEQVAADARERAMAAAAAAVQPAVSRKRDRAMDDDEEASFEYKRYRHIPADHDMMFEPAFCGPYAERFVQSVWWAQPMCQ